MRSVFITIICIIICTACSNTKQPSFVKAGYESKIHINQLGFLKNARKEFIVVDAAASEFVILDTQSNIVYEGVLKSLGEYEYSGELIKKGFFTELTNEGTYIIYIKGEGYSYPFIVSDTIMQFAAKTVQKSFYYRRTGTELESKYAGKWSRPYTIGDMEVHYPDNRSGFKSCTKGWLHSDDYNKYSVISSLSVAMLIHTYQSYKSKAESMQVLIPRKEGHNSLLSELEWELDWLLSMQDDDGGVFSQIYSKEVPWVEKAYDWNSKERFLDKKTVNSSLCFAGAMAKASTIEELSDSKRQKMLNAAKRAWAWFSKNSNNKSIENEQRVSVKYFYDEDLKDEIFWASTELYSATNDTTYSNVLYHNFFTPTVKDLTWQTFTSNLAFHTLLKNKERFYLNDQVEERIEKGIVNTANEILDSIDLSYYNLPTEKFLLNSNLAILNRCFILSLANEIHEDDKYKEAMLYCINYLFGQNTNGLSFVTGIGSKYPIRCRDRHSFADSIHEPIPGLLVYGPCNTLPDNIWSRNVYDGSFIKNYYPAKYYSDEFYNYHSNAVSSLNNAFLLQILYSLL